MHLSFRPPRGKIEACVRCASSQIVRRKRMMNFRRPFPLRSGMRVFTSIFAGKSDNMCVASYVLNLTYIYGKKIRDRIRTREPTSFISSTNLETVPERLPRREKNVVQSKKAVILAHLFP